MMTLILRTALLAATLAAVPALALDGVPSLIYSTATMPGATGEIPTLMVVPDGSGPDFTMAVDPQGNVVDATIEVFLCDGLVMPIYDYPKEDIWGEVEAMTGVLTACTPRDDGRVFSVIRLDDNTDRQGIAHFSLPQYAGGYAEGLVHVAICGTRLESNTGIPLRFNSPDINGDQRVNLSDVVILARDYHGEYHFRSDLAFDGVINLSDVARFAVHLGASCP